MSFRRFLIFVLPWLMLIGLGMYHFAKEGKIAFNIESSPVASTNHHMIVERVEALGKLELIKFYIKDIVEHKEDIKWWPFDPKAVLLVSGEVVGCIDLTKVDSVDVSVSSDLITILLPEPEICYNKVNHKESRVYNISNLSSTEDAHLIDRAYKVAEEKIEEAALEMQIINQTKANAKLILKPILESLLGKQVYLRFKSPL